MDLPAASVASRAVLIRALANLAREYTGSMGPNEAREVLTWIEDVETRFGLVVERACALCRQPGHTRTTCTAGIGKKVSMDPGPDAEDM
jgi:hypothetical protein